MKIAAILVPVALFLIMSFAGMAISLSHAKRGRGIESSRPIPRKDSKRLVISMYLLMFVILPASVAWSAYVFTGLIWLSVLFFLLWSLPVLIVIFLVRRWMPKPPPGGWPDEKTRLDAIAKWNDARYKHIDAQEKRRDAEQEQKYQELESLLLHFPFKRVWSSYARLFTGVMLSLFGLAVITNGVIEITNPASESSLATNIILTVFLGILPLAGGIALCVFDVKKWRKPNRKHQSKARGDLC